MKKSGFIFFGFLGIFMLACTPPTPPPAGQSAVIAFVNANVIPMDSQQVIPNQTVLVSDGRITSIATTSSSQVPAHATSIDASGLFLIPALTDMHIHLEGDAWNMMFPAEGQFSSLDFGDLLFPYVANGVAMVQVMSALPEHVDLRAQIASGDILGPRLILSRMIDGPDRAWPPPLSTWVASAEEARQAVLDAHQAGYDRIKVYSFLDRDCYAAILATASELGMGAGGHLPSALSLEEVLAGGQDLIAHAEEVMKQAGGDFSPEHIDKVAQMIAASDTWITPTLTTSRHLLRLLDDFDRELARPEVRLLHPMALGIWAYVNDNLLQGIPQEQRVGLQQGFDNFQRPLTLALHEAGAKLMVGTDALFPTNVAGFSVHDELVELVEVGMSPYEALRASTTRPFEFLGELADGGTIEVGKRADLVLLSANPLLDISNTRQISGVMIGGKWLSGEQIREKLAALAAGYIEMSK